MLIPNSASGSHDNPNDLLQRLHRAASVDNLGATNTNNPAPNPNPKKKQTNPYSTAKKINTKIQALAGKLTEIMVWETKVSSITDEEVMLLDSEAHP